MKILKKMDDFFSNKFQNLSKKSFKWQAVLITTIGDLSFIYFIRNIIFQEKNLKTYLTQYSPQIFLDQVDKLSKSDQTQMLKMMAINLDILIVAWILISLVSYLLFLKDKKWGISYIKNGTALLGVIFSFVTFFEALQFSVPWAVFFLLLTPFYIYMFFGMRKFY